MKTSYIMPWILANVFTVEMASIAFICIKLQYVPEHGSPQCLVFCISKKVLILYHPSSIFAL